MSLYEDDYYDYDQGYDDDDGGYEMSPEDRASMKEGTLKVKDALGPDGAKVTVKQVEEALWHYYFDVDKSVTYLRNKFVSPAKSTKSTPKKVPEGKLFFFL